MSKIFLCHASDDKKFVEELANDLLRYGLEVWFDKFEMKVGESLLEKINDGITESGYFAVILSNNSINKPWVKHEIQSAFAKKFQDNNFKILPILYQECCMPYYLSGLLYADFTVDYNKGLSEILNVFGISDYHVCTKNNWRLIHKKNIRNKEWKKFKDSEYLELVTSIFPFCYENRWGIYVGGHSNPYAISFSANYLDEKNAMHTERIHLRFCSDDKYRISLTEGIWNPNHLKASDYTVEFGSDLQSVRENLMLEMLKRNERLGKPIQTERMYVISRMMTEKEQVEIIREVLNKPYVFDGDFRDTIKNLYKEDHDDITVDNLYI